MITNTLIKKAIRLLERKVGYPNSKEWGDKIYGDLSNMIFDATKIRISISTLKRFFGKVKTYKDTYKPQIETKNAIALYLGYKDWNHYVIINRKSKQEESEEIDLEDVDNKDNEEIISQEIELLEVKDEHKIDDFRNVSIDINFEEPVFQETGTKKFSYQKYFYISLITIVLGGSLYFNFSRKHQITTTIPLKFELVDSVQIFPFTAQLNYDASNIKTDSLFVEFGDNFDYLYSGPVYLNPNNKLLNHSYLFPDYYTMKLMNKNSVLLQKKIHVITDNWIAVLSNKTSFAKNFYSILPISPIKGGRLFVPDTQIWNMGINKNQNYWLEYRLVKDFGFQMDNMNFETFLKNDPLEGGINCNDIIVILRGENNFIQFNFLNKGCTQYAKFFVSEVKISGRENDLSAMGRNVQNGVKLKLKTDKYFCELFCNDTLVAKTKYSQKLGNLKLIEFVFKGVGSVDYVTIEDTKQKKTFHDSFETFVVPKP